MWFVNVCKKKEQLLFLRIIWNNYDHTNGSLSTLAEVYRESRVPTCNNPPPDNRHIKKDPSFQLGFAAASCTKQYSPCLATAINFFLSEIYNRRKSESLNMEGNIISFRSKRAESHKLLMGPYWCVRIPWTVLMTFGSFWGCWRLGESWCSFELPFLSHEVIAFVNKTKVNRHLHSCFQEKCTGIIYLLFSAHTTWLMAETLKPLMNELKQDDSAFV